MGKSSPRNPLWPDWFDGEKIDEVTFCHELIRNHPMKCIENRFFTPDGPVEDEAELKQLILKEIQAFIIHGLSKRVANLLESLRIIAYSAPLDIEVDCIHLKNGIYHLADGTFQESRLFCRNRLPVAYNPKAAKPERWLAFLNELLEPEDIPTLQEYLGYCLIPCTKGQKMMFLLGKGGEGKSRIGLVLKKLMGDAVSNGSIQKVETSRFARADLENRLLMVDDDLNMNALPKTNYIKSIVTAEAKMDVERKGIQSYQSDIYARFLCFGNGALTALYDHSDGFWRRQLVLTTKDRPANREDDPFLVEPCPQNWRASYCGVWRAYSDYCGTATSSRSVPKLPPIWRPSKGTATTSLIFWTRRATFAIRQISPSVPKISTRSTSCGVRIMPVTQYRQHGLVQRSARTLSG